MSSDNIVCHTINIFIKFYERKTSQQLVRFFVYKLNGGYCIFVCKILKNNVYSNIDYTVENRVKSK